MNQQPSNDPASPAASARGRRRGLGWALAPVLILGGGLLGLGIMTALALDDPSFALEENYYQKAVDIDQQRAQETQNRELGWTLEVDSSVSVGAPSTSDLLVRLVGPEGPLDGAEVRAEGFHNARASQVRTLEFRPDGPGRYRARLDGVRPGLWELRFRVTRYGAVFTSVERLMLGPGGEG
jgi:nitrogen fixation protein FixH